MDKRIPGRANHRTKRPLPDPEGDSRVNERVYRTRDVFLGSAPFVEIDAVIYLVPYARDRLVLAVLTFAGT